MALFWKTMLVVKCWNITSQLYSDNFLKLYIIFSTYLVQTNIWKLACLFDLTNQKNKSSFEILSLNNILINRHCLENVKIHVCWKIMLLYIVILFLHECHLQWNTYSKGFILNFCTLSTFPALEVKKSGFVGNIYGSFMVNLFVLALDIPVIINILYEMIKILHNKILNAIYLNQFHNDTSDENNSLWSFQQTLHKRIEARHISQQKNPSWWK